MKIETEIINSSDEHIAVSGAEYHLFSEYVEEYDAWFYYLSIVPGQPSIMLTLEQFKEVIRQLTQVNLTTTADK